MLQIFVNGNELDLPQGEEIVLQKAIGSLADFSKRKGPFTSDFNLPLTHNNISFLGYNFRNETTSDFAYQKQPAEIRKNGRIWEVGFLQLVEIDHQAGEAQATFFGGNVDWFQALQGKNLRDLDLSDLNHNWTEPNISGSFANTEGYIYACIAPYFGFDPTASQIEEWYPSIYQKTLIERIFKDVGYKVGGSFTNYTHYQNTVLPVSRMAEVLPAKFGRSTFQQGISVSTSGTGSLSSPQDFTLEFDDTNDNGLFNLPSNSYVAPSTGSQTAQIKANFTVLRWDISSSSLQPYTARASVAIFVNGAFLSSEQLFETTSTDQTIAPLSNNFYSLTTPISLTAGDVVTIRLYFEHSSPTGTPTGEFRIAVNAFSLTSLTSTGEEVPLQAGRLIDLAYQLPNITQIDFIKDMLLRHGLQVDTDSYTKTVNIFPIKDCNDNKPNALNWTDKADMGGMSKLNFTELVEKVGQSTYFRWARDEEDSLLEGYRFNNTLPLGDGVLAIGNQYLTNEVNFYESNFAPTYQDFFAQDTYLPYIPRETYDGNGVASEPRILICLPDQSFGDFSSSAQVGIFDQGGALQQYTECPFAYFSKQKLGTSIDDFKESLAFQEPNLQGRDEAYLLNDYYRTVSRVWNRPRMYKALIRLFEHEYESLDFSIPVYIENARVAGYFIIDEIEQYDGRMAQINFIQI